MLHSRRGAWQLIVAGGSCALEFVGVLHLEKSTEPGFQIQVHLNVSLCMSKLH